MHPFLDAPNLICTQSQLHPISVAPSHKSGWDATNAKHLWKDNQEQNILKLIVQKGPNQTKGHHLIVEVANICTLYRKYSDRCRGQKIPKATMYFSVVLNIITKRSSLRGNQMFCDNPVVSRLPTLQRSPR